MAGPHTGLDATPVPLRFRGQVTAQKLAELRRLLADWVSGAGLAEDTADAVVLSGYEALVNVVEHAYPGHGGLVELDASWMDNTMTVTVADHGRWRHAADTEGMSNPRGRGLVLIRGLSDRAVVDRSAHGTTVMMTWLFEDS